LVVTHAAKALPPTPSSASHKSVEIVKAIYDYDATDDTEISFKAGDQIMVLEKGPDEWWKGEHVRPV
jgi:uncharacterized protein (DUF2147 family)